MADLSRSALARYGTAVVAVVLATGLRLLLDPVLRNEFPFPTLLFAVLIAAWFGGSGPAVVATLVGAALSALLLLPPRFSFAIAGVEAWVGLLLYLAVGLAIAFLGGAMGAARRRAQGLAADAIQRGEQFRIADQRFEDALREHQERLRVTLASIGDGVISTGADGRVTFLNPAAEALTGWRQPDAQGQPLESVLKIVDEQTRRPVEAPMAIQGILITKGGKERPVETSTAPIRDAGGVVVGAVLTLRDVTERRRSEQARRRLAAIVESSDDAILSKTLDGTITSWNEGAERLYGYLAEEAIGQPISLLTPPDRAREMTALMEKLKRGEWTEHFQTVRRRKDGRLIHVSVNFSPIRNDAGDLVGASTIARDITDQKRVERELAEFFENASVGLHWVGPDGVILRANQAELALLGYSRDEYVGRNIAEFHVDGDAIREVLRRLETGETLRSYSARLRCKDGSIKDVVIESSVLRDEGRFVHTRCFTRDVTQQRAAEQALRNSERLYRAIGESIGYGVWVCDPQGRNTYTSDSFLKLVGLTQEQAAGAGWAKVLHPEDAEDLLESWKECVRTGCDWDREMRVRGVDGQWHPVLSRGVPVRNEQGEVVAFAGINLDISRLKQVEQELREADRRKDQFLAVLAHELRNPLAPVRNALHILKMAAPGGAAAEEAREMAERQVHHLTRLVDDLLDVSRMMSGKIALRKERVELSTVVARAVEAARPAVDAEGHELMVSLPREPIVLEADAVRLAQVLSNLLNNAARYTESGGRIWIAAEPAGGEVAIRVGDNGIGLAPDELTLIFDLFTQTAPGDFRSQGGLGIGLTLVRTLVEMHDGTVEARSAGRGRGSEFVVRLPLPVPVQPRASGDAKSDRQPAPPSRRVLVVDDNVDAAESLAMVLRLEGHDVEVAHSGPSALAAARTRHPECVLLDIGMPGMDGYEVARTLRVEPGLENVTLVALTGWGQEEDRQRSKQAGFDHHLTKPVEPSTLQAVLSERRMA